MAHSSTCSYQRLGVIHVAYPLNVLINRSIGMIAACMAATGSAAVAQESAWRVSMSDDGTVVASVSMMHTGMNGETLSTVLNVGFDRKTQCKTVEFGVAALRGSGYGDPIGRLSPPRTEPIDLDVDGRSVETPLPYLVKYDNGFEAIFVAGPDVIHSISTGRVAIAQIVPGSPRFEFPIYGGSDAISEAQQRCMSGI